MDADTGRGESPQVGTRAVVLAITGVLAVLVLIAFGCEALFPDRIGRTFVAGRHFPAPAVVPDERTERLDLEARQRRTLNGGSGRMPIDAAMKNIADRGQRAFDPVAAGP